MTKEGSENNYSVYVHTTPSGKMYVGITKQKPEYRWGRNGINYKGQMFYNAIEKYGWDNIEHEIIAEHLTEDEAKNFEITLIDKLHTADNRYGYNVTLGGESGNGYKWSEEGKKKISENSKKMWAREGFKESRCGENASAYGRTGEKHPMYGKRGADNPNSKKVICITTGEIYDSAKIASKVIGVSPSSLCTVCRGEKKSCGKDANGNKLVWMYYEDYLSSSQEEILKRKNIESYYDALKKKIVCVTTLKIYKSITDASIKTGIGDSNISSSCKGKRNYAGKDKNGNKLHWMYYDDYKNVVELFYGIK